VHEHDDELKQQREMFLTELGLEPVLHREADEGQTIIGKIENHSEVGYAFILLTPDEIAYLIWLDYFFGTLLAAYNEFEDRVEQAIKRTLGI